MAVAKKCHVGIGIFAEKRNVSAVNHAAEYIAWADPSWLQNSKLPVTRYTLLRNSSQRVTLSRLSERLKMAGPNVEELSREFHRLLQEQIESLKKQTFGGLDENELRQQQERLKRIREVSADFLAALKKATPIA
jgi:recombinational DNA repair ATPase RecF